MTFKCIYEYKNSVQRQCTEFRLIETITRINTIIMIDNICACNANCNSIFSQVTIHSNKERIFSFQNGLNIYFFDTVRKHSRWSNESVLNFWELIENKSSLVLNKTKEREKKYSNRIRTYSV